MLNSVWCRCVALKNNGTDLLGQQGRPLERNDHTQAEVGTLNTTGGGKVHRRGI